MNNKLSDVLNEMIRTVKAQDTNYLDLEDVCKLAGSQKNNQFYNKISLEIAQKYQDGLLSYVLSDDLMNGLWFAVTNAISNNELQLPQPFFEIYEAFDAGEYHRRQDQSDNPIKDYTDPMIREILSRNSHSPVI